MRERKVSFFNELTLWVDSCPTLKTIKHYFEGNARPEWACEFPDWTGPDTQIYRTGPTGPD